MNSPHFQMLVNIKVKTGKFSVPKKMKVMGSESATFASLQFRTCSRTKQTCRDGQRDVAEMKRAACVVEAELFARLCPQQCTLHLIVSSYPLK